MADAHHDEPDVPGLPEIQDEAADTPMWVPATGLALLAALVLMLVYHVAQGPEVEPLPEGEVAVDVTGEAGGAEAPEAAPAGDGAAADDHAGHGH